MGGDLCEVRRAVLKSWLSLYAVLFFQLPLLLDLLSSTVPPPLLELQRICVATDITLLTIMSQFFVSNAVSCCHCYCYQCPPLCFSTFVTLSLVLGGQTQSEPGNSVLGNTRVWQ